VSLRRSLAALLIASAALFALSVPAFAGEPRLKVVAEGLDNPRGLDISRFGAVYVTEAGRGGSGPCRQGPEGGEECVGASGAVTRIWHGRQHRVLRGLPSLAVANGEGATGPQDISIGPFGGARLVVGLGGDPAQRAGLGPLGPLFGKLFRVSLFHRPRAVADIAAYEAAADPDEDGADSNPNSVLSRFLRTIVVDAGGNDLLRVGPGGRITTLAVFPERLVPPPGPPGQPPTFPMDAVPTSVVSGPDRAYYVGQLTGFPFPVGGARVYRVDPGGSDPEVYAQGFTNITDIAFGPDGSLYVLEFATNGILSGDPAGALKRVRPNGSIETVVSEGLVAPTGLAIDRKGHAYISNYGALAGVGQVVKVKLKR
jgi:hypothetical protein